MCNPICLPIGCMPVTSTISTPDGYADPPARMHCVKCGEIGPAVYKKRNSFCCICFCPIIPCGGGNPYIGCSKCGEAAGGLIQDSCSNCGLSTLYSCKYCPSCGASKNGRSGANYSSYKPPSPDNNNGNPSNQNNEGFGRRKIGDFKQN